MSWTAILLAGQRPGIDPLAQAFGEKWKAKVAIEGESMLSRVAKTLLATEGVDRILIVAQNPEALFTGDCAWMAEKDEGADQDTLPEPAKPKSKSPSKFARAVAPVHPPPTTTRSAEDAKERRIFTAVSTDGIAVSVARLAGGADAPFPILVTTADHPLLTPAMIKTVINGIGDADVGVGVVAARTLLAAYPDNQRTWLRFRGEAWTGANLFALNTFRSLMALDAWAEVERDRKKALKLLWHFGPLLAIRAATRMITLKGALEGASKRLGFRAVPIAIPYAEAGIDVDKPSDHALATTILAKRADRAGQTEDNWAL